MPRHPENVDPASADLEDEEHVDPTQQRHVDGEEVTRKHRRRLGPAELPPRRSDTARSRVQTRLAENVPHRRGSDPITQSSKFAVNAAVTPTRILTSKPDDQVTDHG